MKTSITLKTVIGLVACAQLLSACTDRSESASPKSHNGAAQVMGTGDGGGGNAINFRMLESYKIDPTSLPAAKELQKLIDLGASRMVNGFKFKNWYLAPINLNKVPKDVLGISFSDSSYQQIAIQTKEAVWIDESLFNQMTILEQATLLTHELVMAVYLTRFYDVDETLKMLKASGPLHDRSVLNYLNKILKSEPVRSLNANDYEEIRNMTAWLMNHKDSATNEILLNEFSSRDYFKHIEAPSQEPAKEIEKRVFSLMTDDLKALVDEAIAAKRIEADCRAVILRQNFSCDIKTENNLDSNGFKIIITNKDSGKIVKSVTIEKAVFDFGLDYMGSGDVFFTANNVTLDFPELPVGAPFEVVRFQLVTNEDKFNEISSYKISGLSFMSTVASGEKDEYETDPKLGKLRCLTHGLAGLVPKEASEDIISVYTSLGHELGVDRMGVTNEFKRKNCAVLSNKQK